MHEPSSASTTDSPSETTGQAAPPAGRRGHRAAAGEGDVLRTQLLDAAEWLLAEKGSLEAVSLRQVARAVGVSATSVYLHFQDKDDLFIGVCSRRFETLAQVLRDARAVHDAPVDKLRASARAYVSFGLSRPVAYNVLFGALPMELIKERVPPDELVGLQTLAELAQVVGEGMTLGVFRKADPMTTAISLWAVCHGLVGALAHGHGDDGISADAVIDSTIGLVLHGLVATDPRTR